MDKPTKIQYFFASGYPLRIWFIFFAVFGSFLAGYNCFAYVWPVEQWHDIPLYLFYIFLGGLAGFFIGFLIAGFTYWIVAEACEYENGGPLKVGDKVQVLAGQFKDEVSVIYSEWQRGSFRVELGEQAKNSFEDIFARSQLLKVD